MAESIPIRALPVRTETASVSSNASIPWYIWVAVAAVTLANAGAHWDISWHRSIGRVTYLTPPHIAIYVCGVLAGISSAYLILATKFRRPGFSRTATVKMWGFQGPLGAFLLGWGSLTMLTSAPFHDWWQNAYGLDLKIISPPHLLLIVGILAVQTGALLLVLGQMNRATGAARSRLNHLYVYIGGMMLILIMAFFAEELYRPYMRTAAMYRLIAIGIPLLMAAISRSSGAHWAATKAAAVYTFFCLGMLWILPLFPAEAKLGPVFNPVTHFVPLEFPLLLIIPAIFVDLIVNKLAHMPKLLLSILAGMLFLGAFAGAQWLFADFLNSGSARNWFFGAHYFDYIAQLDLPYRQYKYIVLERTTPDYVRTFSWALFFAIAGSRLGIGLGEWMRKVKR